MIDIIYPTYLKLKQIYPCIDFLSKHPENFHELVMNRELALIELKTDLTSHINRFLGAILGHTNYRLDIYPVFHWKSRRDPNDNHRFVQYYYLQIRCHITDNETFGHNFNLHYEIEVTDDNINVGETIKISKGNDTFTKEVISELGKFICRL